MFGLAVLGLVCFFGYSWTLGSDEGASPSVRTTLAAVGIGCVVLLTLVLAASVRVDTRARNHR